MAATLTARLADDGIPTLDDVLRNADNSFFVEKESALHQVGLTRSRVFPIDNGIVIPIAKLTLFQN